MRKRILLIVAPLCVVVLAAGVAFAAPDSGEHARDARLDNPHAVRPTAASPEAYYPASLVFQAVQKAAEYVQAVQVSEYIQGIQIGEYIQAVQLQEIVAFVESVIAEENARAVAEAQAAADRAAAAQAAASRQVTRSAPAPATSSGGGGGVSGACGGATNGADGFIARESGGNPNVYNAQGSGAWGCYQIMPQTWAGSCSDLGSHGSASVEAQAACASRLPLSSWSASGPT
jgi:hypothetical protein